MSLSKALQAIGEDRKQVSVKCSVGVLLNSLDQSDRSALVEALANPQVSSASLSRFLKEHDYDIRHHVISNHRRRFLGTGCRCES
jgi:hypothetical protein